MTKLLNQYIAYTSLALCLLVSSPHVMARGWQLMAIPSEDLVKESNIRIQANGIDWLNAEAISHFEAGIAHGLRKDLNTLVMTSEVLTDCTQQWCGRANLNGLAAEVRAQKEDVQALVLYAFTHDKNRALLNDATFNKQNDEALLHFQIVDPLSLALRFENQLSFNVDGQILRTSLQGKPANDEIRIGEVNSLSSSNALATNVFNERLRAVGESLAQSINAHLNERILPVTYQLIVNGFKVDELSGLSTYILSNSPNSQLKLLNSSQNNHLLGYYQPLVSTEYELSTSLSASQYYQLLKQYFMRQNIDTMIDYQHSNKTLSLNRVGNPFMPSLLSLIAGLLFISLCLAVLVRRQYLQYYLHQYSHNKQAQRWLGTYEKAAFPLYRLKQKWEAQASYWLRVQKDSEELAKQAKMHFEAGDLITAKLFVSKSLHINTDNEQARAIALQIESYEKNTQLLSENEQWIHNKVAKAMNSYRQQQPIKALRRAYQARDKALQIKDLKKQAKAIKKLINKIKAEFVTQAPALMLNCSSDRNNYLVCQNETVQIGRLPNKTDTLWISNQDSVFYVNHKSVSRLGQQCQIERKADGFYLQDMGSKNGSIVNGEHCLEKQLYPLDDKDEIQLGAQAKSTAVVLNVSISESKRMLQLSFSQKSTALLDKKELNKIWPDNTLATRTSLVCTDKLCFILFDTLTRKMNLRYYADIDTQTVLDKIQADNNANDGQAMIGLFKVKLGDKASISPVDRQYSLQIDDIPLIGEVPLIFPCNLQYTDNSGVVVSFQLSEYDSTAIRYAQANLLESSISY
jgi:pSer/pThr/pTyr-binding forkhead associated (FHA) protein